LTLSTIKGEAVNINLEKNAPYAPFGCVINVIRRFRERGLAEIITIQEIVRVGVSEGNASRTLQSLKFLRLVDEEGHRTQMFDRLARVPTNEYAEVLGEIIKAAYKDVFVIVDPADATDIEINDAFRYYQPQAQRSRMVALFRSLCQEAGLISGGPPETRRRTSNITINKLGSRSIISRRNQAEEPYALESNGVSDNNITAIEQEYGLLFKLLQQLPSDKKWTKERHDRWLQAFTANIDLLIDIE